MLEKSKKKAKERVAKAIHFYSNSGKDIALAEFTNPKGPFVQDEMYIFVLNHEGTMLAHGSTKNMRAKILLTSRMPTAKIFIREIVDTSQCEGERFCGLQMV